MTDKLCCLSFDDGPNLNSFSTMTDMLDLLEKHHVTASFFLIGNKINAENEGVIKRAMALGCDIENHSWSHPNMPDQALSAEEIKEQVQKTDDIIFRLTGKKPLFFRPPYISVNDLMYSVIQYPFINGHACDDWLDEVEPDSRLEKMLSGAKDGVIFLLHVNDGNFKTTETVDRAIPILKSQGYSFVTVPELFKKKNITPAKGGLWTYVE